VLFTLANNPIPNWRLPEAAYIHIPFCAQHCGYCDFAIAIGKDAIRDNYLDALEKEISKLGRAHPVQSWFIGGGTPTELNAIQLERLCKILKQWLPLTGEAEFSIEANPDSTTEDKLAVLANYGLTRLSLGVQSFQEPVLQLLDRKHKNPQVERVIEDARRLKIPSISIDLIFGSAGQSLESWKYDLARGLALYPDHFSTYGLTYEKGTPLWKRMNRGEIIPLEDTEELAHYEAAIDTLEAQGMDHYEISSFAKKSKRCWHNQVYWENSAYYGFGMGAARYVAGKREVNTRDLDSYIQKSLSGQETIFQSEQLEPREEAVETLGLNFTKDARSQSRTIFHAHGVSSR
jgi:oxygen-independent coproporphyrinogen III oxidase